MWALCKSYLSDDFEAAETLNDGFLKIFQNIRSYDPGKGALYTWMRKIMVNCALDVLNKKKRLHFLPVPLESYMEPEAESELLDHYQAEQILLMIDTLPDSTRTVFNLYTLEGYSHQEIAQILQISDSTSRWHVSEARKRLRKLLNAFKHA